MVALDRPQAATVADEGAGGAVMSETTFTPGPWRTSGTWQASCNGVEIKAQGCNVAVSVYRGGTETPKANAHLIAAAPDMYEALLAMNLAFRPCSKLVGAPGSTARMEWEFQVKAYEQSCAAIAKARGRS